jgi:hypothetical protein
VKFLGKDCGCDARREIMFDAGNVGMTELIIAGACVAVLVLAWRGKP